MKLLTISSFMTFDKIPPKVSSGFSFDLSESCLMIFLRATCNPVSTIPSTVSLSLPVSVEAVVQSGLHTKFASDWPAFVKLDDVTAIKTVY